MHCHGSMLCPWPTPHRGSDSPCTPSLGRTSVKAPMSETSPSSVVSGKPVTTNVSSAPVRVRAIRLLCWQTGFLFPPGGENLWGRNPLVFILKPTSAFATVRLAGDSPLPGMTKPLHVYMAGLLMRGLGPSPALPWKCLMDRAQASAFDHTGRWVSFRVSWGPRKPIILMIQGFSASGFCVLLPWIPSQGFGPLVCRTFFLVSLGGPRD
jgi:hypothetical protein